MANRVGSQRGKMVTKRLVLLANFFNKNATPEHPVPWSRIKRLLEEHDCAVTRKTFYADIYDLSEIFKIDVYYDQSRGGWYVKERLIGADEVQTIVKAVQFSPIVLQQEADALIEKIKSLTDFYTANAISCQIEVERRLKENMDRIYEAIRLNRRIRCRYIVGYACDENDICDTHVYHGAMLCYGQDGNELPKEYQGIECDPVSIVMADNEYRLIWCSYHEDSGEYQEGKYNIADIEHVDILEDNRSLFIESYPADTEFSTVQADCCAIAMKAKNRCKPIFQMLQSDLELIPLDEDSFTTELRVDDVTELIPYMLMCEGDLEIVTPEAKEELQKDLVLLANYLKDEGKMP